MKEGLGVTSGEYLHQRKEQEPYFVFGVAKFNQENFDGEEVGIALWVDGFEKSGSVSGEQIRIKKASTGDLVFELIDPFTAPSAIVFYRQDYNGMYEAGQLWARSVTDFVENFEFKDAQ